VDPLNIHTGDYNVFTMESSKLKTQFIGRIKYFTVLLVMIAAISVIIIYLAFPSTMITCKEGEILYEKQCFKYINSPIMLSSNEIINRNIDGCTLVPLLESRMWEYRKYLEPSCNQHDICYLAIDALNYGVGNNNPEHMIECDDRLISGWENGCAHIHPQESARHGCDELVYILKGLINAMRGENETNRLYEMYSNSVKRAASFVGTDSEINSNWIPFMESPFMPE
jgi:hypothetical protein